MKSKNLDKINWKNFGPFPIVGVDEVGRGCLAGPVYAGAVIFRSEVYTDLVTDSKLLSESRREEYSRVIWKEHDVGIGIASVEEVDELNILQASLLAMQRAVEKLPFQAGHILVDGNMKIPGLRNIPQTPVVKGDLRVSLISAASIVAKVARDQLMKELGAKYPEYGFSAHKGYSTKAHKDAIALHGPGPWHRKSFSGVKEHLVGI